MNIKLPNQFFSLSTSGYDNLLCPGFVPRQFVPLNFVVERNIQLDWLIWSKILLKTQYFRKDDQC